MKPANYSPVYCALYPKLAEITRSHGYALAVHGSMARDFDLVCIPWVESPSTPNAVVSEIEATFYTRCVGGPPTIKDHGREVWTLSIGHGECAMDLSFMPRVVAAENHMFEFWWSEHMHKSTQSKAFSAWKDAVNATVGIASPPKRQPVSYGVDWGSHGDRSCVSITQQNTDGTFEIIATEYSPIPNSAQTKRQPLTDEQIDAIMQPLTQNAPYSWRLFARAIEAVINRSAA